MALGFLAWHRRHFPDSDFTVSLTQTQRPLQGAFPSQAPQCPRGAGPSPHGFLTGSVSSRLPHRLVRGWEWVREAGEKGTHSTSPRKD